MNVEDSAIALTERLARLLETEFEALSGRDLERLETLTEQREGLLKQLFILGKPTKSSGQAKLLAMFEAR